MLEAMGIIQYADTFIKERINGKVFLGLDEKVLLEELCIDVKIHRAQLLSVISGKRSAETILRALDS